MGELGVRGRGGHGRSLQGGYCWARDKLPVDGEQGRPTTGPTGPYGPAPTTSPHSHAGSPVATPSPPWPRWVLTATLSSPRPCRFRTCAFILQVLLAWDLLVLPPAGYRHLLTHQQMLWATHPPMAVPSLPPPCRAPLPIQHPAPPWLVCTSFLMHLLAHAPVHAHL